MVPAASREFASGGKILVIFCMITVNTGEIARKFLPRSEDTSLLLSNGSDLPILPD
jgi:hypothetical protein